MILETILSTMDKQGKVNFAPMGLHIPDDTSDLAQVKEINLRLYKSSQTLKNLETALEGVLNLTDDVLAFVETALFSKQLPTVPSQAIRTPGMAEAKTRWEFSVIDIDYSTDPVRIRGETNYFQELRGPMVFCRAQGAVLEALICATRWQWIPKRKIGEFWPRWQEVINKTGGKKEREAMQKIKEYLIENVFQVGFEEEKK